MPASLLLSTVFYASLYFTFADCFVHHVIPWEHDGVTDLPTAAPKLLRYAGPWPSPTPRRAGGVSELRRLQDSMPRCEASTGGS